MKKIFFSMAIVSVMFTSCGQKKWEYKTVQVDGVTADEYYGEDFNSRDIRPTAKLNSMGAEGWELVSAYPILETVHPNFGNSQYVTGLQSNTRTKAIQFVFKREKSGSDGSKKNNK